MPIRRESEDGRPFQDARSQASAGRDVADLPDSSPLADELLAAIEAPDYRPPALPSIVTELVALADRVDTTLEETLPVVDRDDWFSSRLRTVASEEARSSGIKLGSMRQVCLYFGILRMRDLAIEWALEERVLRSDALRGTIPGLRRHALATAHLGRAVAESISMASEGTYLAGLLHDVGIAGVLHVLAERGGEWRATRSTQLVWPAIEAIHARVGAVMARHWGFSDEIQTAIETHHVPPVAGEASPMALALSIANELAHHEGFGPGDGATAALDAAADEADEAADGLESKREAIVGDRTSAELVDRQVALLGLTRPKLYLIAHRAKRALGEIDLVDQVGSPREL
ncbi:HDOD domain-containing protein [Myxococcota bacterium]|nr:HDOD domain-containing protein [Myxococcota bacterium]